MSDGEEGHGFDSAWELTQSLPDEVIDALDRPPGAIVAIVATVDADGSPRTAAFGSVRPITPALLRFGCNRAHDTYANVLRDGRVMVAVFSPPGVAVGIRGRGRVIKEQMETLPHDAVIEIQVESVKNDLLAVAPLASGITYTLSDDVAATVTDYNTEVEGAG